jgi:hypothetical protein
MLEPARRGDLMRIALTSTHTVMPGLVPGIHVLLSKGRRKEDMDGRDKPGHDERGSTFFWERAL